MQKFKLYVLTLLVTLSVFGCSTTPSVARIELLQPPASCLSECSVIPEVQGTIEEWSYDVVQMYAECAISRKQCSTALVNRFKGK